MLFALTLFLLLVVVGVVAVATMARSTRQSHLAANQVVPGVPTNAPAEWAGSHSPEARLHRRLRDAVAAMNVNPALADLAFAEARAMVETEALAVDDRLVAVGALAPHHRAERLPAVDKAVDAIEAVVAEMVDASLATADTEAALAAVRTRLEFVAEARAELAGLEATSPHLDELRRGLEQTPSPSAEPSPPPPASSEGEQPPEAPTPS